MEPETEYGPLLKYFPLAKVEEDADGRAVAWGLATAEIPDQDGERAIFSDTCVAYAAWADAAMRSTIAAGQEGSEGGIRLQHSLQIAGKAIGIEYLKEQKQIWVKGKAVNDEISMMLREGYLRGYSHAGRYAYRKCGECGTVIPKGNVCQSCHKTVIVDYAPAPPITELSFCDSPCLAQATFSYVKSGGGGSEIRKFKKAGVEQDQTCPKCEEEVPVSHLNVGEQVKCPKCGCEMTVKAADAYFLWVKANGSTELIKAVGKAEAKTKRVDGEDLTAGDFLIATDKDDPETWKLPWKFSSEEKTVSHLRNALARFGQLQDVPVDVKAKAWKRLVGLCKKHGIEVSDDEKKAAGASNVHGLICPACGEETEGGAEKCPKCGRAYQVDPGAGGQRKPSLGEPGDTGEALGTSGKAARHPTGRFASRASGELHDCLTAAGYEHTRTGTEAQVGPPAEPTATACYSHEDGRQRVTVREDGAWEHEDGKGRRVTGSGKDALAAHLAACGKAAGAESLAKYSDDQPRDDHGRWGSGASPEPIAEQHLWQPGSGMMRPASNDIGRANGNARANREMGLKNLGALQRQAAENLRAQGGTPEEIASLNRAFTIAGEHLAGKPLIEWHSVKGSVLPVKTDGHALFVQAMKERPEIKTYMDAATSRIKGGAGKAAGASGLALDLDGTAREEGGARKGTEHMTDEAVQELVKAEVAAAVLAAVPLQKDLSHVAYMSGILASMAQLRDMVDAEAKRENDDRDVAIALSLNRLIDDGSDILRDLVEDETTELTAPGGGDEEDEGPIQLAAAAKAVGAGSGAGIEAATAALNNL